MSSGALTITVMLGCVIFAAWAAGGEMFSNAPASDMPVGTRDREAAFARPVYTIRPVIHDPYGIPESEFKARPPGQAPATVNANEEISDGLQGSEVGGSSGAGAASGSSGTGAASGSSGAGAASGSSGTGAASGSSGAGAASGSSGTGAASGSAGAGAASGSSGAMTGDPAVDALLASVMSNTAISTIVSSFSGS
eukprot:jgi/Tetstr1/454092/TSEL_041011.t1